MKTIELTGALLDYWVAKAEGIEHPRALREMEPGFVMVPYESRDEEGPITCYRAFQPSSSWIDGGPIIERERFVIDSHRLRRIGFVVRHITEHVSRKGNIRYIGKTAVSETLLVAAMRAYVASKFGNEVPDAT